MSRKEIVCLFPGIGYTCDRPLLYYSGKMFAAMGREVVCVRYGGFPGKVKGDREKMARSAESALAQAEEILKDVDWNTYDSVLFISKSIGTAAAAAYAQKHHLSCGHVLFTPVEATFDYGITDAVIFHGTADPWADPDFIREACKKEGLPLFIIENANHSLETGDVDEDIRTLREVMKKVREYAETLKEK